MKGIALVTEKGGAGKTSLGHLIALGCAWRNTPAYFMHTDSRKPLQVKDRPYGYLDARDPDNFVNLMQSMVTSDGLCIIDGAGNRPEFDTWISEYVDLVIIPVTADQEAVDLAIESMQRIENSGLSNARYLLNSVSTNKFARQRAYDEFFSQLDHDKIMGQIKRVEGISRLKQPDNKGSFPTPPSNINNLARYAFNVIMDELSKVEPEKETALAG